MTHFGRLIGVLSEGRVEFVIIGGLAATIHGSARLTQDVDVVYARSEANIARMVSALRRCNRICAERPRAFPSSGPRTPSVEVSTSP